MGRVLTPPQGGARARAAVLAAAGLGAALLAACGSGDEEVPEADPVAESAPDAAGDTADDEGADAGSDAEATVRAGGSASEHEDGADGAAPDEAPDEGADDDADDGGGADWESETDPDLRLQACVVGEWVGDNDQLASDFTEMMTDEGMTEVSVTVEGELLLTFTADGEFTSAVTDYRHVIDAVTDGEPVLMTIQHEGDDTGTWTASGGNLTMEDRGSAIITSGEVSSAGFTMPLTEIGSTRPWHGTLIAECSADRMSLVEPTEVDALPIWMIRVG